MPKILDDVDRPLEAKSPALKNCRLLQHSTILTLKILKYLNIIKIFSFSRGIMKNFKKFGKF